MKIAVLDLIQMSPVFKGLPTAGEMIRRWLCPALPEATLALHPIAEGAPLPRSPDFDGLLLSGSEKGVYDETPWMPGLRNLLLQTRSASKPIFGICFGHQIMADTFGGKAELAGQGQVIGVQTFEGADARKPVYVWHQDQVTKVPPGAQVTLSAPYCPVAALAYDFPAMSVQNHPEFTESYLRDHLEKGQGVILSEDEAAKASATLDTTPDNHATALEVATFFRAHA